MYYINYTTNKQLLNDNLDTLDEIFQFGPKQEYFIIVLLVRLVCLHTHTYSFVVCLPNNFSHPMTHFITSNTQHITCFVLVLISVFFSLLFKSYIEINRIKRNNNMEYHGMNIDVATRLNKWPNTTRQQKEGEEEKNYNVNRARIFSSLKWWNRRVNLWILKLGQHFEFIQ